MYKKVNKSIEQSLFFNLDDILNGKHPLYILANKVNWQKCSQQLLITLKEHWMLFCSSF